MPDDINAQIDRMLAIAKELEIDHLVGLEDVRDALTPRRTLKEIADELDSMWDAPYEPDHKTP